MNWRSLLSVIIIIFFSATASISGDSSINCFPSDDTPNNQDIKCKVFSLESMVHDIEKSDKSLLKEVMDNDPIYLNMGGEPYLPYQVVVGYLKKKDGAKEVKFLYLTKNLEDQAVEFKRPIILNNSDNQNFLRVINENDFFYENMKVFFVADAWRRGGKMVAMFYYFKIEIQDKKLYVRTKEFFGP